jgi:Uma2 family endonuclease
MASTLSTPAAPEISVEEYIARFVEGGEKPTSEYIDGELFPKSMGTKKHSKTQQNIQYSIRQKYEDRFDPLPELTTRLREREFLVPDVAVEDLAKPIEGRYPGPSQPVFLCVEIMSPPDRFGKLAAKCERYHAWTVSYCWIIDPETRTVWEYTPGDYEPRKKTHGLTAGPITLTSSEIFHGV